MATRGADSLERVKRFFKEYYQRTSILRDQIPYELRNILLPEYMLYGNFKADLFLDTTGRLAFEITRPRSSRISIKPKKIPQRVESEVLGTLGKQNLLSITARDAALQGIVLTHSEFLERYPDKHPPNGSVLNFGLTGDVGPICVGENADVKLIDVDVYWVVGSKPRIKSVHFAWFLGNANLLENHEPNEIAEGDFYRILFGRLMFLVTEGYHKISPDKRNKAIQIYSSLLLQVENELRKAFRWTEAQERAFHQLIEKYRFFVHPHATCIESEVMIGKYRADLKIRVGSSETIFVEIEPAHCKPFQASEPSSRLLGALEQINNWKEAAKTEGELMNQTVGYWIIIGLEEDMSKDEKECLEAFANTNDVRIYTYDHILGNIQSAKQLLDKLKAAST